jgi:hypothetical protein
MKKSSPSPAGAQSFVQPNGKTASEWSEQVGFAEPNARVLPPRNVWSKTIVSESALPKIRVTLQPSLVLRLGSSSVEQVELSGPGVIVPWRCMTVPTPGVKLPASSAAPPFGDGV